MKTLRELGKFLLRLLVVWIVDAVSILVTAVIIPGIYIEAANAGQTVVIAVSAALMLGIVNFLIRPIILMLARPLGLVIILVVGIFMNAIVLKITSNLIPEFVVTSWWYAFLGGLIFSAINTVITNLMTIDDEDSFYEGLVRRLAVKNKFPDASGPGQGL
jgi:putative membrane protein